MNTISLPIYNPNISLSGCVTFDNIGSSYDVFTKQYKLPSVTVNLDQLL